MEPKVPVKVGKGGAVLSNAVWLALLWIIFSSRLSRVHVGALLSLSSDRGGGGGGGVKKEGWV